MNPLISIIVPVYNVEAYLDRCVKSIVNQTYKNLEIILVDDGSTDNSGKKCDEWANKDTRIVVIHKENGGQASARNEGLKVATGSLIGFVDSDDYIDLSMYESMQRDLVVNNADIAECNMLKFHDQNEVSVTLESNKCIVMNREEAIKDFLLEAHLKCTVPNMLIKADIAKQVLFDEGKTHEDILWPYRAYILSDRVIYIDTKLYYYFQRPGSTMNKAYSSKRFDGLDALEERANLVKKDFPKYYNIAARSYLGSCMYQFQYLCRQPKSEEFEGYKKILHSRFCNGDHVALFEGLSIKYRFWYSLFKIAPGLTAGIRNLLKIGV